MKATTAITLSNLATIPARWSQSLVIVASTACVIGVLTGVLAMSKGFEQVFVDSAGPNRVLFVRRGTVTELQSNIKNSEWNVLSVVEGLRYPTAELYSVVKVARSDTGRLENVSVRGVPPNAFDLRPEIRIEKGRHFQTGKAEAIVGVDITEKFQGLAPGDTFHLGPTPVVIVGTFTAGDTIYEGEVWVDLPVAQSLFQRFFFSVVHGIAEVSIPTLRGRIDEDLRLEIELWSESEFYRRQAEEQIWLFELFGYTIAFIIAIGAVSATLSTMYHSVGTRTSEIATLRALGFSRTSIAVSIIVESLVLAIAGSVLASTIVYFALHGTTTLSMAATPVAFDYTVTRELVMTGILWSIALGVIGGALPAVQAVRSVTAAQSRGAIH